MAADFSWTPPLVVFTLGVVAGAVVVVRRSRARSQGVPSEAEDTHASDQRRRYDTLIRQLAEGTATPEERNAIELQAAKVLMELESPSTPHERKKGTPGDGAVEPAAAKAPASVRTTSAWAGFLYGVLTMGILGALVYFASQGSTERAEGGSPTGGNTMGPAASGAGQTSAPEAAEIRKLEEAVRATPNDIAQRIELTRAYVRQRDLMSVFDQTKAVLEIDPGNAHGLTYQALVRVAMGQADQAESMLEEAIRKDPRIEDAYIHLAVARIQLGKREAAEAAIQEGQRQFPQDKELLADVFRQISSAAEGQAAPVEHPQVEAPSAAADAASARTDANVVVSIELPKGVVVPDNAVLFVMLREAGFDSGPPVAVKRVPARGFPITVTLSEKDSMAGESLPGLVRVEARLDLDGNALTKDPGDLRGSDDNVRPGAGPVVLVLTPGQNKD